MDLTGADLSKPQWDRVAEHIKVCAVCRQKVVSYQRLDQAIGAVVEPPAGLAERITAACHDVNARETIRPFPWWRSGWGKAGIAAALLAFAGLTAVNVSTTSPNGGLVAAVPQESVGQAEQSTVVATTAAEASAAVDVAQLIDDGNDVAGVLYERGKPSGSVNSRDLRSVSIAKTAQVTQANSLKYLLPDTVRHVWTVDDLLLSRRRLAEASTAMQAPVAWSKDGEQGRLKAVLRLTDSELQQLVDKLGDGQWALVSPFLPQPNAPELVQLTGKRLLYEIILVQREQ